MEIDDVAGYGWGQVNQHLRRTAGKIVRALIEAMVGLASEVAAPSDADVEEFAWGEIAIVRGGSEIIVLADLGTVREDCFVTVRRSTWHRSGVAGFDVVRGEETTRRLRLHAGQQLRVSGNGHRSDVSAGEIIGDTAL